MSERNDAQKLSDGLKDANTIRKTAMKAVAGDYLGAALETVKNPMAIFKAIIVITIIPIICILSLIFFPTLMFSDDINDAQLAIYDFDSLEKSVNEIDSTIKEVYEKRNEEITNKINNEINSYKQSFDYVHYEIINPLLNGEYYAFRSSYLNSIYSFLKENHKELSLLSFKKELEKNIIKILNYELTDSKITVDKNDKTHIYLTYTITEMEPEIIAKSLYGFTKGPPERQVERISDMSENLLSIVNKTYGLKDSVSFTDFTNNWIERYSEEANKNLEINFTPSKKMITPTTGRISSDYGWRIPPTLTAGAWHNGIDIANSINTPIVTPANGIVIRTGNHNSYGLFAMVYHGKVSGINYFTLYAHMNSIECSDGQTLNIGDTIGLMGSTGDSTGSHLHFEVRKNTETLDPELYFDIK